MRLEHTPTLGESLKNYMEQAQFNMCYFILASNGNVSELFGHELLLLAIKKKAPVDLVERMLTEELAPLLFETDQMMWTPLHLTLSNKLPLRVIKRMIELGANINSVDLFGKSILREAIWARAPVEVLELLLANGADCNFRDDVSVCMCISTSL